MMNQEKIELLNKVIQTEYSNIAGIVVLKNGAPQYESYFNNCTADSRIHVYSVAKSILCLLIGIAIDKGFIQSVEQKMLDFFPDYKIKKGQPQIQDITLGHLLTMTAPYKPELPPFCYIKYFMSDDWVRFTLEALGGKKPIGDFHYRPLIGPDILSGILVKATGQSVFDFATEHLFLPLGMTVERNIFLRSAQEQSKFNKATNISGWVADAKGINAGGWGLTLSATDMAKIGQLCLTNGICNGVQIVSAKWLHESTKKHSHWDKANLDYGYLWWIFNEKDCVFAAMGDGGNVIYCNAKKNLVISIASLFVQNAKDRIELIKKQLEPMFE